tara:strand:- start:27878 stop:28465 length:588 start_codon:yes stop_codon:yes gene_type:complete
MNKKIYMVGIIAASLFVSCGENTDADGHNEGEHMEEHADHDHDGHDHKGHDHDLEGHDHDGEDMSDKVAFGPKEVDTASAISTAELLAQFEGKTEMEATFKGEINEVCSKMGCWVNIKTEDEPFMVRFKDHFTIPTVTEPGTMAYLTGTAIQDTVSVDEQRHYLEDAEAPQEEIDAITEPKYTMTFIAEGIRLDK